MYAELDAGPDISYVEDLLSDTIWILELISHLQIEHWDILREQKTLSLNGNKL